MSDRSDAALNFIGHIISVCKRMDRESRTISEKQTRHALFQYYIRTEKRSFGLRGALSEKRSNVILRTED